MSKSYFILFFTLLFLASCGQSKKEAQLAEEAALDSLLSEPSDTLQLFEEEELSKAVDEFFDDFFFTFATNAHFQNQRIRFPLHFDDEDAEILLTKEDWHRYNRFGQQEFYSVIYENEEDLELQKDTSVHEVSVQWIYLQDGYVEQFNFKRIPEGQWVLFNIEKQDISESQNGEFVNFYSQFVADSTYQRSCLATPLPMHVSNDEGDDEENELSAEDWFEMKSDMPFPKDVLVNINYGQFSSASPYKNMLMEGVSNGLFLNFRFEKGSNGWKLVKIEI